jgi:hypothetical protein
VSNDECYVEFVGETFGVRIDFSRNWIVEAKVKD